MLVEELRVGSLDGARPESFAALKGLVALPGGGFAVLDSQAQEIRVFGADGSHVATHGRPGEGPGEFVDATGLMLDPQGRIWAADPRGARMSVFDPVDGFLESFRYQYMVRGFIWDGHHDRSRPHPEALDVARGLSTDAAGLRFHDDADRFNLLRGRRRGRGISTPRTVPGPSTSKRPGAGTV